MGSALGSDAKERWIPNTGEYLVLSKVRYTLKNNALVLQDLQGISTYNLEVYIDGAIDRGYDESKSGTEFGNIYNNSECKFEVALVRGDGAQASIKKIGTLVKNIDKPWLYHMDYSDSDLYDNTGKNKNSTLSRFEQNRIWVDTTGRIIGIVQGDAGYSLAIRPENAISAYPGDDLLLRFGIRKQNETEAIVLDYSNQDKPYQAIATMKDSDYIAVYDKKMLWRANLYIDEGVGKDWNDAFPWNDPANNEWFVSKADGANVDGGQIKIMPHTSLYQNTLISDSVAYSTGGLDSFDVYNNKMASQQEAICNKRQYRDDVESADPEE